MNILCRGITTTSQIKGPLYSACKKSGSRKISSSTKKEVRNSSLGARGDRLIASRRSLGSLIREEQQLLLAILRLSVSENVDFKILSFFVAEYISFRIVSRPLHSPDVS